MSIYAIGDIQGCFNALQRLLEHVHFDPAQDQLWLAGDLVNRGPESLDVLRWVKQQEDSVISVLGNHDLHLLARYYGVAKNHRKDTLDDILSAPDCDELMEWLRHRPLVHYDSAQNWCMNHAGLPPQWTAQKAKMYSKEVEAQLQGEHCHDFLHNMYGNQPDIWDERLEGIERYRVIVNYLTRMRFIDPNGRMDLKHKEKPGCQPAGFYPWFDVPARVNMHTRLIFGHWAALEGHTGVPNVYAVDTGCVWGKQLTALRLNDLQRFAVEATSTLEPELLQ